MNAKQYKYVLTLANEGSFSKAADVLNITQPSLSQYIKKIEKQLGLPLFDRSTTDVRLTDAGRVYVETARKVLDLEHQMDGRLTDLRSYKTGSLIIGAAPYRAASMLPLIASRFQSLHPGMHLVVREGTTAELVEGMEHGEYDLCLTMLPIDEELFSYEKVLEEELVLAVPASFPSLSSTYSSSPKENSKEQGRETSEGKKRAVVDVEALNGQSLVMLTDGQFMQKQLNSLILSHHLNIHTAAIVKSLEAQIEFVKAGVGMALVPSGIERFCTDGSVNFYSFSTPLPKREVVVMWRKDIALSKTANELKDVIHSIVW